MSLKNEAKQITDLPPIIGGPIVRKVESNLVGIWVALQSAATIELSIWQGEMDHEDVEDTPVVQKVEQDTVQIGKHLHLAVVTMKLKNENTLQPETIYSYNMKFTWEDNSTDDFQSLQLLDVADTFGNTAISYQVDQLPSFVLAPRSLEDLKILHGSCRNNANQYEDALAWVDDFIKDDLLNPIGRPHQLFLSGDQIYADSVLGNLLHNLTEWGNIFLDNQEKLHTEWVNPDGGVDRFSATTTNFPSFYRNRLVDSDARLTGSQSNHLLAFGEFAAMYLSVWSDTLWDVDNLPTFEEVFNTALTLPESYGAIFRRNLTDERNDPDLLFDETVMKEVLEILYATLTDKDKRKTVLTEKQNTENGAAFIELNQFKDTLNAEQKTAFEEFLQYLRGLLGGLYGKKEVEIEGPDGEKVFTYEKYVDYDNRAKTLHRTLPKVRRALANISTYMMFDDHEISDDWNLNPAWRDRVHSSPLGRNVVRNGLMSYALFQDWGNRPGAYLKQGYLVELDVSLEAELENTQLTDTLRDAFAAAGIILDQAKTNIKKLVKGEWLLEESGRKDAVTIRKYEEADGSEVLKAIGNPHSFLLSQIMELFQPDNTGPNIEAEDTIDFLLGIDHHHRVKVTFSGRYELPKNRSPLIKWHYGVKGSKHKVLVVDNRTRRSFVSFAGAPGNLDVSGMKDLIPANPSPKDDEVLIVVAPLPILGPSVLDEFIAPAAHKVFDYAGFLTGNEKVKSGMKGTNPDAIEAWVFDPESQEEILKRLAAFKKVVILSGDVHYASSQGLFYWKKNDTKPACFAQLTSSGLRNVMPSYIQIVAQRLPTASKLVRQELKAERLAWKDKDPSPLVFPDGSNVNPFLKHKLRKEPVLISTYGWPEGTKTKAANPPDWSWRMYNVLDMRKEADRPELTQVESMPPDTTDRTMDALRKIAARHITQAKKVNHTRQILFQSNIGMVGFEKDIGDNTLYVHHNLYGVPFKADPEIALENRPPKEQRKVYCLHKIPLDGPNEEKPEL
ncbi:MAG: hypothetical protein KTR30_15830 [Saprospiraceae bacterium]|nr:hypothetical protein [Saprospiraceae bacterium]